MITLYRRLIIVALGLLTIATVFAEPVEVPEPLVVYKTIVEKEVEVKPEIKAETKPNMRQNADTTITKKVEVKKVVSSRQAEADAQPDFSTREVQELIRKYAGIYGVDEEWAKRIAGCESGFRAKVKNKSSAAAGPYQFLSSTFASSSQKYGRGGESRFNADANVDVAIQKLKNEGRSARSESRACWNK